MEASASSERRFVEVYQCLCHVVRLRILNLLEDGPLCVCHLQTILEEPQVKVSKHLAYLRRHGLIEARRRANWVLYALPAEVDPVLEQNLRCLEAARQGDGIFSEDLKRRRSLERDSACDPANPIGVDSREA